MAGPSTATAAACATPDAVSRATSSARVPGVRLFRIERWVAAALLLAPAARGVETEPRPVPVVDLHVDLSYQVNYKGRDLARGVGQYVAADLLRSGVRGVVLPLYIPRSVSPEGPRTEDLEASRKHLLDLLPQTAPYALPGCAPSDDDHVRTWFAFEGAAPLASDPESVNAWIEKGVRVFGLVHTYDNALATSSGTRPAPSTGLTERGREVVRRIQSAGGIVDVSHMSDAAAADVIELARGASVPVIATHSNARKLADHPRNLNDQLLRAIAATGGVVGVNFHSPFVVKGRAARIDDVVRQVQYLVRVAGEDHVALGSDFEGDIRPARGLADVRGFPKLAVALRRAGLGAEQVRKVFSGNALRVLCP